MKRKLALAACLSLFMVGLAKADCEIIHGMFGYRSLLIIESIERLRERGHYSDYKAFHLDGIFAGTIRMFKKGERVRMVEDQVDKWPKLMRIEQRGEQWYVFRFFVQCR